MSRYAVVGILEREQAGFSFEAESDDLAWKRLDNLTLPEGFMATGVARQLENGKWESVPLPDSAIEEVISHIAGVAKAMKDTSAD